MVAARMSATETPGARSRSTRPSGVGSMTARSVTTRFTGRIDVSGRVHSSTILALALGAMDHGHDHASGAGDQVHRPAHAGHELSGDHPVGQPSLRIDLQAAQHGQVEVPAANQAEGEGAVEAGCARDGRDEAAAGVHEVRVLHARHRPRAHARKAVLGLEEDGDARGQEGGDLRGQADAQVHQGTRAESPAPRAAR